MEDYRGGFMQYTIARTEQLSAPDGIWEREEWQEAETLEVTHFSWEDSGHHPKTQARLLYNDTTLAVIFCVEDRYIRAVAEKYQDGVCRDSCVEFFVAPLTESDVYFNFEVNCGGTTLLHRNPHPEARERGEQRTGVSEADWRTVALAHSMPRIVEPEVTESKTWTVEYHVPFALFHKYFDGVRHDTGTRWRANFYKCGDQTSHPHWGSWAPVDTPRPNFHVPASFQTLVFA